MANICTNYLSIAEYDNGKKDQIIELLNEDRDATFELLKTGMPEFRIYDDDFGTAYYEKETNEIHLSFLSAWGGNPEGVCALSSHNLLKNTFIKYSRKTEGDPSAEKWFFKNGESVNSKGEIKTNRVPSQKEIKKVENLFQDVEKLFKKASKLSEKIDNEEIDREDPNSESLNFLIDEERYEVFKDICESWKEGNNETLKDIDMAGLAGVEDEGDLEYNKDEIVNVDFFIEYTGDFISMFEEAIRGLKYCIDNNVSNKQEKTTYKYKISMPQKIENSSDFVKFAEDVILRFEDKDEGRRLFEKAEENAENSSDFVKIANSVILKIVDKDWGKVLFEKAEENAEISKDFVEIGSSVSRMLEDKDWGRRLFEQAEEKANISKDYNLLRVYVVGVLEDKDWSKSLFEKSEENAKTPDDYCTIAAIAISEFKDKDKGLRYYKKAVDKSDKFSDFLSVACGVYNILEDKDWGRRLFKKAEDNAKTTEDARLLKLNQLR